MLVVTKKEYALRFELLWIDSGTVGWSYFIYITGCGRT